MKTVIKDDYYYIVMKFLLSIKLTSYGRKVTPIVKKGVIPIVRNTLDWLGKELSDIQ